MWSLSNKDRPSSSSPSFTFFCRGLSSSSHALNNSAIFELSFGWKVLPPIKMQSWLSVNCHLRTCDSSEGSKLSLRCPFFSPVNLSFFSLIAGPKPLAVSRMDPPDWSPEKKGNEQEETEVQDKLHSSNGGSSTSEQAAEPWAGGGFSGSSTLPHG